MVFSYDSYFTPVGTKEIKNIFMLRKKFIKFMNNISEVIKAKNIYILVCVCVCT